MYSFDYQYRVRYADTDQMGFVYYGNYARLYEIGRVEALRALDFRYKDMEDSGVMMPVYENTSRFIAPALYDELLTVRVLIKTMPSARVVFDYEIYNPSNVLIHTGKTTLVFLKSSNNRLTTCPPDLVERLKPFFE
jgi:acyl-CoA thioester hydrolase